MGEQNLAVRRARARDAAYVAAFVNGALNRRASMNPRNVIARLGDIGMLLAEDEDKLVGLLGWRAENLVACVTDLIIQPASKREPIGQALFETMENAARDLQAEAAILFLPPARPAELSAFLDWLGYESRAVSELPRAWREVVSQAGLAFEDLVPVKRLRSDSVFTPL